MINSLSDGIMWLQNRKLYYELTAVDNANFAVYVLILDWIYEHVRLVGSFLTTMAVEELNHANYSNKPKKRYHFSVGYLVTRTGGSNHIITRLAKILNNSAIGKSSFVVTIPS